MPLQAQAMSLNVQDADAREILNSVAQMAQVNIIVDESVTGKVSIKVEDMEPEEIIANIARARGLGIHRQGKTLVVAKEGVLEAGFAQVQAIPVQYADLEDVRQAAELFLNQQDTVVSRSSKKDTKTVSDSKTGKSRKKDDTSKTADSSTVKNNNNVRVLADIGSSSLLVYGTGTQIEAVRNLVQTIDVKPKQISIEAKVISIDKKATSKLGLSWDWSTFPQYPYSGEDNVRQNFKDTGVPGGIISFGRGPEGHPFEMQFSAKLEAMLNKGNAKILSRPNIITLQGREALINIGGEVPVPSVSVTNSTTTTSIDYRPVGIILKCRSMVNADGYITSQIHTEVSAPSYVEDLKAYSFQKRSADTMVRLKDGQTMVIGGLISSEDSDSVSKIPFLGDIPILGNFFKATHKTHNKSEIIIVLKAKIMDE